LCCADKNTIQLKTNHDNHRANDDPGKVSQADGKDFIFWCQ